MAYRLYQQEHSQAIEGNELRSFIQQSLDHIWSTVPGLRPLNARNALINWTECSGGPPRCLGAGGPALSREAGGAGLIKPGEEEASGGPNGSLLRCSLLKCTEEECETMSING